MTPAAPAPGDEPGDDAPSSPGSGRPGRPARPVRKQVLLRLDPAIHDAVARWAADDLRSVNAQIDLLLRRALKDAGRLPRDAAPARRPGRPSREDG
ncbi:hypothetical protein [Isoptericola sp. NPDC019482]|uniref:hypothetical protein n=1 Tax=Isoptericola sp. NPDC019482 TaxID=3154688 RepID=UPI003490C35D